MRRPSSALIKACRRTCLLLQIYLTSHVSPPVTMQKGQAWSRPSIGGTTWKDKQGRGACQQEPWQTADPSAGRRADRTSFENKAADRTSTFLAALPRRENSRLLIYSPFRRTVDLFLFVAPWQQQSSSSLVSIRACRLYPRAGYDVQCIIVRKRLGLLALDDGPSWQFKAFKSSEPFFSIYR
jgi:hypothetical protein